MVEESPQKSESPSNRSAEKKPRPKSAFVINEDENGPVRDNGEAKAERIDKRFSPEKDLALQTLDSVIQEAEESMGKYNRTSIIMIDYYIYHCIIIDLFFLTDDNFKTSI